ncbi:MAG: hypothetical protein EXS18_07025 [Verrucomicrobiae bacterium]|nr:hypothetical protein [Verrucomicrobiae bacterium]
MKNINSQRIAFFLASVLVVTASVPQVNARPEKTRPQPVHSYRQLVRLLKQHTPRYYSEFRTGLATLQTASAANTAPGDGAAAAAASFSSTTVQVAGVDEGDIVKNDGSTIYQINRGRVLVIHAFPADELDIASVLDFSDGSFYPQELYLDGTNLIVIGTAFQLPSPPQPTALLRPISYFSTGTVKAQVYDVSDVDNPTLSREIEIDGDFVASRKIGSIVYLLSRRYPDFYPWLAASESSTGAAVPSYRDTATGNALTKLRLANCYYFPGFDDPNYLIIASFDLANPDSPAKIKAYLGAGNQVYASQQNLYVTSSGSVNIFLAARVGLGGGPAVTGGPAAASAAGSIDVGNTIAPARPTLVVPSAEQTDIYKFALNSGSPSFVASATVTGSILNPYSMDEFNDTLRVATTEHGWWNSDSQDANNLFVLDADMQPLGTLTNIAPGERIYATRFLGNRAFLVTFQNIDPLFAIDLSDPTHPTVVGELILPGYSNFLVPFDANHLIGFGKDVLIANDPTASDDVPWWNGLAYYQGMKIVLFDVSDLHNPVVMDSVSIGDRGTDSPVLYDPHALLFDAGKGLIAFPVTIAKIANADPNEPWQWGDYEFQGAYVYNVSLENGFELKGTVTHKPEGENIWSTWGNEIERVLDIGDGFYTLSGAEIRVNDVNTLEEKATLELPQPPDGPIWGGVPPLSSDPTASQ